MIHEYAALAIKTIASRKVRSWLTMIGIFIGIASLVALIGLGEGLRVAIISQFGFLGSDILSVQASGMSFGPPGTGVVNPLTDDLPDKIAKISNVEAAFARYIATGTIEFNNKQIVGYFSSMPSGENRKIIERMANLKTSEGRLLKDSDRGRVVLGGGFSDTTTFGRAVKAGDNILLKGKKYQVIGILEKKGSFITDNAVMMNDKDLFDDLGVDKSKVSVIAVKVKDQNIIDKTRISIEKLLRKERDVKEGEEDFSVQSPKQTLETLNQTLFAIQLFVYIIAGISLLVGGIGIMNTMYTSVLERTKEIGIMKSIGARNSTIFTLFFFESGFMGIVGGIVGVLLGLSLAYGFAAIGRLALNADLIQAQVSIWLIVGALSFSFILGTVFGVLPAMQASKLRPVESLRQMK